jgi:hypothetical protein
MTYVLHQKLLNIFILLIPRFCFQALTTVTSPQVQHAGEDVAPRDPCFPGGTGIPNLRITC